MPIEVGDHAWVAEWSPIQWNDLSSGHHVTVIRLVEVRNHNEHGYTVSDLSGWTAEYTVATKDLVAFDRLGSIVARPGPA